MEPETLGKLLLDGASAARRHGIQSFMAERLLILLTGASGALGRAVAGSAPLRDIGPFFRGLEATPVARAARAFDRSVEGLVTDKTCRAI